MTTTKLLITTLLSLMCSGARTQPYSDQERHARCTFFADMVVVGQEALDEYMPPTAFELFVATLNDDPRTKMAPQQLEWAQKALRHGYKSVPRAHVVIIHMKAYDDCTTGKFD